MFFYITARHNIDAGRNFLDFLFNLCILKPYQSGSCEAIGRRIERQSDPAMDGVNISMSISGTGSILLQGDGTYALDNVSSTWSYDGVMIDLSKIDNPK